MRALRTSFSIVFKYRYTSKYVNRYESGSCISDPNKTGNPNSSSKNNDNKTCDVCRSYPCECDPSAPTMYDCRKYGHNLPCDNATPHFETIPNLPTGIFRCTAGEVLGRGANKCSYYQNPEYFSYHHMTFYDMHMLLRCYRNPSPKTGRKP
ncbi:unnamed protein product [Euphydryas editha]|uniref:NADH dehydrogenase [ubiquinone] flavoprotein 3, mitochondrial n=1 Tax=Euphydryas editha TaxID=104508 RepID=A0AAU9UVM6_EUPED|nr:unnamed protein product [Euphydryas editha]